jgi:release factor glutamine methyltransferase
MTIRELAARLKQYDEQEARSIVLLLLYDCFGMTMTDICTGALEHMSCGDVKRLEQYMQRLEQGEPVQYVTGKTVFCGRDFHVEKGVLIPRPETEELCELIINGYTVAAPRILDVGTGSGCIAITLASELPHSTVSAWDVSEDALRIASGNADNIKTHVVFEKKDILKARHDGDNDFDIIVSNPPYICDKEAADMEPHVLCHEPHLALFVPDDDPLLFYRSITQYAATALSPLGMLYFEINPIYADALKEMICSYGFDNVMIHDDQFGKHRFISARR